MLCASLVCATATARYLASIKPARVTFVVSGGLGAEEDLACAELIAACIDSPTTDPTRYLMRAQNSAAAANLFAGVERGYVGVTAEDVPMCLDLDRFDFHLPATIVDDRPRLHLPPQRA